MRHLKVKRTNVAHRLPRGKRASWNGNQHFQKQQSTKTAFTIIKKPIRTIGF
ncbi:hypothetical protein IHV12_02935 [Fictibacillus sp. 7GRE50]|uniref:hypothetical protein n=1 Tax=Fictibacillus sp. 7GRE50 TaxID=2745878 RepID=UPI0018CE9D31|nr:hypothetical protein [Fictibacillus sp. 7GRE50]MBH0163850.1 hypothetical protein [Fictibacillus sp. 7GRE50]